VGYAGRGPQSAAGNRWVFEIGRRGDPGRPRRGDFTTETQRSRRSRAKVAFSLLVVGAWFTAIAPLAASAGTTDYALMSATPYNSEIASGKARLEQFLYKANAKKRALLAQTPVVAVEAAVLTAAEVALFFVG